MAFGLEVAALTPLSGWLIWSSCEHPFSAAGRLAVATVGIAGAAAMVAYLAASQLLSLPLFGLLGYVEPVFAVAAAFVPGDRMQSADVVIYGLLALALLAAEGYRAAFSTPTPSAALRPPPRGRRARAGWRRRR